jgi:hypothetical protein
MQFTGFLINGAAGPLTNEAEQMYLPFSPLGLVRRDRERDYFWIDRGFVWFQIFIYRKVPNN